MLVDDIVAAIEAARDKIMAEEIREHTKLGMPKAMALQTVAARYNTGTADEEEGGSNQEFENGQWRDNS